MNGGEETRIAQECKGSARLLVAGQARQVAHRRRAEVCDGVVWLADATGVRSVASEALVTLAYLQSRRRSCPVRESFAQHSLRARGFHNMRDTGTSGHGVRVKRCVRLNS